MACAIEDGGFELRDCIMWVYGSGYPKGINVSKAIDKAAGAEREVVGKSPWSQPAKSGHHAGLTDSNVVQTEGRYTPDVTASATAEAHQWEGWGTALKPAFEDWWLLRKPIEGTVANNVLTHGTGALNIDGCRVGAEAKAASRVAADRAQAATMEPFSAKSTAEAWPMPLEAPVMMAPRSRGGLQVRCRAIQAWSLASYVQCAVRVNQSRLRCRGCAQTP
jgi:site-specific DNA-methyltransferase (adenine-specific)